MARRAVHRIGGPAAGCGGVGRAAAWPGQFEEKSHLLKNAFLRTRTDYDFLQMITTKYCSITQSLQHHYYVLLAVTTELLHHYNKLLLNYYILLIITINLTAYYNGIIAEILQVTTFKYCITPSLLQHYCKYYECHFCYCNYNINTTLLLQITTLLLLHYYI